MSEPAPDKLDALIEKAQGWTDDNEAASSANASVMKMLYVTYPVQRSADDLAEPPINGNGHKS